MNHSLEQDENTMKNDRFTYLEHYKKRDSDFVGELRSLIKTPKELFRCYADTFNFPGYFGHNWDALEDCLRDFHWISHKRIVITHRAIPILEKSDLKIYFEILQRAITDWEETSKIEHKPSWPIHELEVIFSEKDRNEVRNFLR